MGSQLRLGLAFCGLMGVCASPALANSAQAAPGSKLERPPKADKEKTAASKGATLTAWGKHGGRKWSVCNERVLEAERALPSFTDQAQHLGAEHAWAQRARACPHAVPVLELAARKEALHLVRLPDGLNGETPMGGTITELEESRGRALVWLAAAEQEALRRGAATPRELDYWRARALLSLGKLQAARRALTRSELRGDVPAAKHMRLAALLSLYEGDLEASNDAARQAWLDAPIQDINGRSLPDKTLAAAVYAVVLDRAGDDEGARRMMLQSDRSGDRSALFLQRIETYMPLHERLYFRGLWMSIVRTSDRKLAIRYFEAYLARPEVEAPERKLAERHIARLRSKPGRLGG